MLLLDIQCAGRLDMINIKANVGDFGNKPWTNSTLALPDLQTEVYDPHY